MRGTHLLFLVLISCSGVVVGVWSTCTRCKVVLCLLEGKGLGEGTVVFTFVVYCCSVVFCVWPTGTRCKVVLRSLEGKAVWCEDHLLILCLLLAVVLWFVCVVPRDQM